MVSIIRCTILQLLYCSWMLTVHFADAHDGLCAVACAASVCAEADSAHRCSQHQQAPDGELRAWLLMIPTRLSAMSRSAPRYILDSQAISNPTITASGRSYAHVVEQCLVAVIRIRRSIALCNLFQGVRADPLSRLEVHPLRREEACQGRIIGGPCARPPCLP